MQGSPKHLRRLRRPRFWVDALVMFVLVFGLNLLLWGPLVGFGWILLAVIVVRIAGGFGYARWMRNRREPGKI